MQTQEYKMWIDGKWVEAESGKTYTAINPANGEEIARIPLGGKADVDKAVMAAQQAFPAWSKKSQAERSRVMSKIAAALKERSKEFNQVEMLDHGSPARLANAMTLGSAQKFEFAGQAARAVLGDVIPVKADLLTYVQREPIGVCALITPWNLPLYMIATKLAPALAMGNTCIVKPPSIDSMSALKLGEILEKAELPPGTVNVITGPGGTVGEGLAGHPLVRKVALTGGLDGGKRVMALAAREIKRVTLELGGQCAGIVWNDFDLDRVAEGVVFQAFRASGQVCNRVNRLYVHQDIVDELVKKIVALAGRVVVGDGMKEGVDIGPLINARQWAWVDGHVRDATEKGAKLECGGGKPAGTEYEGGFFYTPTVLSNCNPAMRIMNEETFGPVLGVQAVGDDLESAFDQANNTPYGLSAYFYSNDRIRCYRAMQRLEAGSLWINDIHRSYLQAPYGGMRQSGIGREQGSIAVDEYLEWKTVYWDMSDKPRGAYACVHR